MKRIGRLALTLLLICVLLIPPLTASSTTAAEIVIHYSAGANTFEFYKVADFSTTDGWALADPFTGYADTLALLNRWTELDTNEVRILSTGLEAVVRRDQHAPTYTAPTDEDGALTLSNPDLGLYLVLGQPTTDGEYVYTPSPILISVPNRYTSDGWQYRVVMEHNKVQQQPVDEPTQYRVLKIWEDDDNTDTRPSELTVDLLRNNQVYDTVVLNTANNWTYHWTDLPSDSLWTAVERTVPDGYTMAVEKDAIGIVLTNTYTAPPPPPGGDIPPTGQLWWPIPILIVLGLVLLVWCFSLDRVRTDESTAPLTRLRRCLVTVSVLLVVVSGVLCAQNMGASYQAQQSSAELTDRLIPVIQQNAATTEELPAPEQPDYLLHPEMEMPVVEVEDTAYVGYLEIPDLNLRLPVAGDFSMSQLRETPARYNGSLYRNNLVIAAHNYNSHFGRLNRLPVGSTVIFTDADGNTFRYQVAWTETLNPSDLSQLVAEDQWDLTLFTCTYNGRQRYTVRCIAEDAERYS